MPQLILPVFAVGVTEINSRLAFERRDGHVTYFNGLFPVFSHAVDDVRTFRMITSQFCVHGSAKLAEVVRAFGVPTSTVKRYCKLYREAGPKGFYVARLHRGPAVLTPDVMLRAQALLDEGKSVPNSARQLGLKSNTLTKAVRDGRLRMPKHTALPTTEAQEQTTTKSQRSTKDSQAGMGMGATNTVGRVMASVGQLSEATAQFEPAVDVVNGGVLFSLPALLATGLLQHTSKFFQLPHGYYGITAIFLLLAWMALCRVKQPESLRYCAPGEWGKLMGLDRIPEVRTLREKLGLLSKDGDGAAWSAQLCADWMTANPEASGVLYVDGHVRVYHGEQTKLPRHHVARQRLCLRATTDYWVNAFDGQPFFLVNKPVDPGMLKVLSEDIIPRLLKDVPGQPSEEQLKANPLLHRFVVVSDREAYSPDFFQQSKQQRVACLTYHKYQGSDWAVEEFTEQPVATADGQQVKLLLAERGTRLSNGLWVREFRKRSESGHQTSILSTDYGSGSAQSAARMFARWSQENFFRYMREHFNLDRLVDYETERLPETTPVVSPAWRELDSQLRSKVAVLQRRLVQFGGLQLRGDIEPRRVDAFERAKAELGQEIADLQSEVAQLKMARKAAPHHVLAGTLPVAQRFAQLSTRAKDFVDTIKMIAYRAETAMADILRETMSRSDDARTLLRQIYHTEADLLPNLQAGTLTVRLHHMANPSADAAVRHLCEELNATSTVFPGTELRLIYELGSGQIP